MKRVVFALGYLALVVALALTTVEIYLRYFHRENAFRTVMNPRLWHLWGEGRTNDPFLPPYDMVANTGIFDEQRLKIVAEKNKPPPNSDFVSHDFLLAPGRAERTTYEIHFNNLGFRDRIDRSKAKPPNTFRIIALGTYHTFGHGLNNGETFPAQLEDLLNHHFKGSPRIEVWNGGRHAGSAIIGLARLKNEIFDYEPNMILLDYGMVDTRIIGDNVFIHNFLLPDNWISDLIRAPIKAFSRVFGDSKLVMAIAGKIQQRYRPRNLRNYFATMKASLSLLESKKIPVVIIKTTLVDFPSRLLSRYASPGRGVYFVSVRKLFRLRPPSPIEREDFDRTENWTTEYGGREALGEMFQPVEYHLNPFQYNSLGQSLIAEGLSSKIEPLIRQRPPETP